MATTAARVRVLFVGGTGRSGSTLVSNLLGSTPGMVSVGELRYFWERGIDEQGLCGCGKLVVDCPFWTAVLESGYPDGLPDTAAVRRADDSLLRLRRFPRLLRARGKTAALGPEGALYAHELTTVFGALHEHTGGALIVDSSKLISYAYLLRHLRSIDLTFLHLVRDSRATAFSWQRLRVRDDRGQGSSAMGRESVLKSSALWLIWNVLAEALFSRSGRYARVRYEDVVVAPATTLGGALEALGLPATGLAFDDGDRVLLQVTHTVAGNPNRMRHGDVLLHPDVEWIGGLSRTARFVATLVTAPLLLHYRYPLRTRALPTDGSPAAEATGAAGSGPSPARTFVEDLHGLPRLRARVGRNVRWAREQGLARVLEEKEIDPVRTIPVALAKWRFRHSSAATRPAGSATPVFIVGVQRSGTNMLARGLGMAPEVELHNENDPKAFQKYKLRSSEVIAALVTASRHTHVLFKPLCDSHRVTDLLDGLGTTSPGKAVWAYRDVDGRVRSALAKFGDGNLQVLREFADGTNTTRWHVQRISPESADLVRSFDYDTMSPESGAALMWLIRNRLYFELGLDQRSDVYAVSYNDFLAAPEATMRGLCAFLDFPYRDQLVRHVTARPATFRRPLEIDPRIRVECDALEARLRAATASPLPVSGAGQ